MDFPIQEKNRNIKKYPSSDIDIAYQFSKELYKECQQLIKGIVLFGSSAREVHTAKQHNDIDILVILDDVHYNLSADVAESYRIISENIIAQVSKKIHVTTLKLSTFWEYVRAGDPVGMNILRDGVAIIDTGFFDPLQMLLKQGRIRPSQESVWQYFSRAPITLNNSRWHLMQASLDLYWAVIDASHALLMYYNQVPPSPAHVADLLHKVAVKEKKTLQTKHVQTMRTFYNLSKAITHREIGDISGAQYEKYYVKAEEFVNAVRTIIHMK